VNKTSAKEWIKHSYHDLNGAKLLYKADHYTDTISYVVHQSLEKSLKSILAFNNKSIKKTHNLIDLYELVKNDDFYLEEDEIFLLAIASKYYTEQRYPVVYKQSPTKEEIKEMIELADKILNQICKVFNIGFEDIK
jgi:HEPN domain-containing protein